MRNRPRVTEALSRASQAREVLSRVMLSQGQPTLSELRLVHGLLSSAAHWVAEEIHDQLVELGIQRCTHAPNGKRCTLPDGHAGEHWV